LNKLYKINWIAVIIFTLTILLLMHPFLKYPFDMYHHLLWIDECYLKNHVPNNKLNWHYFWSRVFRLLDWDNSHIFDRAYLIHYTQTIISYLSVYYFSYTFTKYTLPKESKLNWHTISAWSVFIWFIIYATASMGYHLVWIEWYSINYQISLPLTLLSTAFLFNFLFGKNSRYIYMFFSLITIFIVLLIHSMEFIYFGMYIMLLILIYIDKVFHFFKNNKIVTIVLFIFIVLVVMYLDKLISLISYKIPKIITYVISGNFTSLWQSIISEGSLVVNLFNRKIAVFNELIVVSLYLLIPILLIAFYKYRLNRAINIRLILFLIFSSLFILIPIYQILAGIASVTTYAKLVHRFYYSSTIFLVIPTFSYLILSIFKKEKNLIYFSALVGLILLITFYYSRFAIDTYQPFYKNIQSIKNAWNERKVGFNLSKKQIEYIGKEIKKYEAKYGKKVKFYAREDIAFVIKYIYNKKVYLPIKWRGYKLPKDYYIKAYKNKKSNYKKVLFKTPKDFPQFAPYR